VLDTATLAAAVASAPPRGAPSGTSGALHTAVREALGLASAPQRPLEVLGERERA
jgi:hypothetical protein